MKIYTIKVFLVVCIMGFMISACAPTEVETTDGPTLPPVESLNINFGGLEVESQPKIYTQATDTDSNFIAGLVVATIAKGLYEASIEVPKALLEEAQNIEPEFIGEATWQWSYSSNVNGNPYSVRLTGTLEPNWVSWNFYVSVTSTQTTWDDVLLFTGTTSYDGTEGIWNIFNPVTESKLYAIEWQVLEDSTTIIMNIYTGNDEAAAFEMVYTYQTPNKTVVLKNLEDETQTVIQWNAETSAGFVVSPTYNSGEQACWDENFQNMSC